MPLPLQQICAVDARRRNLDQHLVGTRVRGLDLTQLQGLWRAGFTCDDGFHAPQRAIAQGLSCPRIALCLMLAPLAAMSLTHPGQRRGSLGSARRRAISDARSSGDSARIWMLAELASFRPRWARSHSGLVQAP